MLFTLKDIIYIILIAESILFALFSFTYKNSRAKSSSILGFYMIFIIIFFIIALTLSHQFFHLASYLYYLLLPIFLSINPFYYIYLKSLTTENFKFGKKEILHFIPAFIVLICLLLFFLPLTYDEKIRIITEGNSNKNKLNLLLKINEFVKLFSFIFYYIQLLTYMILMVIILKKHTRKIKDFYSNTEKVTLNWLKIFIFIFIINTILELSIAYFYYSPLYKHLELTYYLLMILGNSIFGFFGIKQADIFTENNSNYKNSNTLHNKIKIEEQKSFPTSKYSKSKLDDKTKISLEKDILELMTVKKLFLNPDLRIEDIANELMTNKTYISQVINESFGKNFFYFVNEYRINEAKRLIKNPEFEHFSFDGIAAQCGFNSRFVLNTVFKKISGQSPSAYKKSV